MPAHVELSLEDYVRMESEEEAFVLDLMDEADRRAACSCLEHEDCFDCEELGRACKAQEES